MSFSINTGPDPVEPDDVENELKIAFASLPENIKTYEHADMATAMAQAAGQLVEHCGLGTFRVSITGHANEGHRSKPGWANTCMNISISQIPPKESDA